MLNIIDETSRNGYVLKNQISLYPVAKNSAEISDSISIYRTEATEGFSNEYVEEFGGLSQTDTHMSTEWLASRNVNQPNILLPTSVYHKIALPVLEDMINTYKSEVQCQNAIEIMRGHYYHNVASHGQQNNVIRHTYIFGQNDTQQKTVPRRKFLHEIFRNI